MISVRKSGNISVHVIAGEDIEGAPIPRKTVRTVEAGASIDPLPYGLALLAVAIATGINEAIAPFFGIQNAALVYLTAIVAVASPDSA